MQAGSILGSPLYEAGVDADDVLLKLDGKKISSAKTLTSLLKKHKPGDKVALEFEQRGQKKTTQLTLISNPKLELVPFEKTSQQLSDKAKLFRESWLK
jgi:S1-C subfamily serine protease